MPPAELPQPERRRPSAEELVERNRKLPRVDPGQLRTDADEYFGDDDRVGTDDPWTRLKD